MDINLFIKQAFAEDFGDGDHTSQSTIPANAQGKAKLLVKQNGIIAGVDLAKQIFSQLDPNLKVTITINDGEKIAIEDVVFTVEGSSRSIVMAERLVLNCMQRMSGIATNTSQYVEKLSGLKTKILDTRKTTPNFRYFEKLAVKIGGGENHRMGLYDMIMIKDNHVDFSGGIEKAIDSVHAYLKANNKNLKIEIEVRNLTELQQVLNHGGVHRIMLDNYNYADLRKAVEMIDGKYETEASGGITIENIREYAECGVDYISVGALTHQIKSLDLSLKAIN
ncbi:MAG: carboxylating nicotinate-nucleotide diphosphorylase [Bacteroidota bacterium]